MIQEDSEELVQLINPEQETDLKPEDIPGDLLILPIKNTVLFPGVVIPITVTRQKSTCSPCMPRSHVYCSCLSRHSADSAACFSPSTSWQDAAADAKSNSVP